MKKLLLLFLGVGATLSIKAQDLPELYKTVNPSTVVISTESKLSAGMGDKQKVNTAGGLGSGVLVSENGIIWTASHVVHSADKIEVKFTDGEVYPARVISSSPQADVASIQITGDFKLGNKHVAKIGNSDLVEIGQDIFIIGAPLGIEHTLSRGIVSGRMSQGNLKHDFLPVEFIQTDAAINPGNSGGPMFNMKGEVIGISSFIMSQSGGFEGIGFGASSNVAFKILMTQKNIWSGMEFKFLEYEFADVFNIPQEGGLLVVSVTQNGLGDKLGLRGGYINATIEEEPILIGGDIILEIAGIKLVDRASIDLVIEKLELFDNKKFKIKYLRDGKIQTVITNSYTTN